MQLALRNLGRVLAECWTTAEIATAAAIESKYTDPPEEVLTFLFYAELRSIVSDASKRDRFDRAFIQDLRHHFPGLGFSAQQSVRGLVARVNLHSKQHEGRISGADFGLTISQPRILYTSPKSFSIVRSHTNGLLVQSKLNTRESGKGTTTREKWGRLRPSQEQSLIRRNSYYALLLYVLGGESRGLLEAFRWQLCAGYGVGEVKGWLRSNHFPSLQCSKMVIEALSLGTIGTSSDAEVTTIVDPSDRFPRALEIEVYWPKGLDPPPGVRISEGAEQRIRQSVSLSWRAVS